jgi:hypothetical protein
VSSYLAQQAVGDVAELCMLRDGAEVVASVRLDVPPRLLPTHNSARRPPYMVRLANQSSGHYSSVDTY